MDLNTMMRDAARNGLKTQLDTAVTNGDTEAATKITEQMEALAVSTAPKAPPYGQSDIKAELDKQPWFGTDPKRSAKAIELGKTLDIKKFATAELFAAALVKAVDEEFKPAGSAAAEETDEEEDNEETDEEETGKPSKGKPAVRRSDAPGEADAVGRSRRAASGPWTKLADAPSEVQKEIKRTADRFVAKSATKEQRDGYITRALESHYATHQRNKAAGKK